MLLFECKLSNLIYCVSILFGIPLTLVVLSSANVVPGVHFEAEAVTFFHFPHIFELHRHVDIQGCIEECKEMERCIFINFKTRMNFCTMLQFTLDGVVFTVDQVKKRGNACWIKPTLINNIFYSQGTTGCKSSALEETCKVKYCSSHKYSTTFKHFGNMFTSGSKQAYGCLNHTTNIMYKETFYCESNGEWSLTSSPCSYSDPISIGEERWMYYFPDVQVSQSEAAERCASENARLVKISLESKIKILETKFHGQGYWADALRLAVMKWETSDGDKLPSGVFDHRSSEYLANPVIGHNCSRIGDRWHLVPTDCERQLKYICEIKLGY